MTSLSYLSPADIAARYCVKVDAVLAQGERTKTWRWRVV